MSLRGLRRLGRGRAERGRAVAPPWVDVAAVDPRLPAGMHGEVDAVRLRIEGLSCLLDLVAVARGRGRTSELTVEVSPWKAPGRDVALRVGHVPGLLDQSVRRRKGRVVVSLRVNEPVDIGDLLASVLPAVSLVARTSGGRGRADIGLLVPSSDVAPFVSVADRLLTAEDLDDEQVRATDVLVIGGEAEAPAARADAASVVVVAGSSPGACVDPAVHRPVGRATCTGPVLVGRFGASGFEASTPDGEVLRPAGRHGLTDLGVAALLPYTGVRFDGSVDGPDELRVLRQLSGSGLVVSVPGAGGDALATLWSAPIPEGVDEVELASVRQRRVAHRDFTTVGAGAPGSPAAPSVSVILSSNRPEALETSLVALARLDYPQLQVVLGLHGVAAPVALERWTSLLRERADVVLHEVAADVPFGAVLAELTGRADGELVTKVDDDDGYGPNHVWDLVTARRFSGAAVVGKGAEFVHLADAEVTVRRNIAAPEKYGRTVAGGTMLMAQADLHAVGGWRPVSRSVDRAVLDRVLRAGAGVYRTHGLGYVYVRRQEGHTWDAPEGHFTTDVRARWEGLVVPDVREDPH